MPAMTTSCRAAAVGLFTIVLAACGNNPTTPSNPDVQLTGDLAFGIVVSGSSTSRSLTITNNRGGHRALKVTDLNLPDGFTSDWTSGCIPLGESRIVNLTFEPASPGIYSGTIGVEADGIETGHTAAISATVVPAMSGVWQGTWEVRTYRLAGLLECASTVTLGEQVGPAFTGSLGHTVDYCGTGHKALTGSVDVNGAITIDVPDSITAFCAKKGLDGTLRGTVNGERSLTASVEWPWVDQTGPLCDAGIALGYRSVTLTLEKQ